MRGDLGEKNRARSCRTSETLERSLCFILNTRGYHWRALNWGCSCFKKSFLLSHENVSPCGGTRVSERAAF